MKHYKEPNTIEMMGGVKSERNPIPRPGQLRWKKIGCGIEASAYDRDNKLEWCSTRASMIMKMTRNTKIRRTGLMRPKNSFRVRLRIRAGPKE